MLLAERSPSDVGAAEDLQAMADRHELDAIERSVDKAEASLAMAGYRVRSQVGHHRVAVEAGRL